MSKKKVTSYIFLTLAIGMTVFIFANSMKTGEESGAQSGVFVNLANRLLGLFGIEPSLESLTFFIRKLGHFGEYFILSVFTALFILKSFANKYLPALGLCYCFAVALCDEFIVQMNTAGRGPSFRDVLIDTAGAVTALGVIFLIVYLKRKKAKSNG